MSEWWTYRLEDFLMFSPRAYWRLIELYNRELWPAHALGVAVGLALTWLAAARAAAARATVAAVLTLCWLWVGWAFHWQRYSTINWGARWVAAAFALQALLLLVAAVLAAVRGGGDPVVRRGRAAGLLLALAGVLLYPMAAPMAGRPWAQAEVFGLAPEPTALATLGLLLAAPLPHRRWLTVIPVLSLILGGATMWLLAH